MARPRKNDPKSLIEPIIQDFAHRLATVIERFTVDRIQTAVRANGRSASAGRGKHGRRGKTLCYYPGCKNVAAPRFGMFCAALHKDLPKAQKEKYRAAHAANGVPKTSGKPGRKRRGPGRTQAAARSALPRSSEHLRWAC